jgi:hypothetical protein
MSGTGGAVYDATPPRSPCERLTFHTVLNSPVPVVVQQVALAMQSGPVQLGLTLVDRRGLKVVIAEYLGQAAGAITSDALLHLIECMEQGNVYVANVRNVSGARVEVQVMRQ